MKRFLNNSMSDATKTAVKRICLLRPMEAEQQTISLNGGANIIGRSKVTGIRDARCSKEQLQLKVDTEQCKVQLKVLGVNPCGVNGLMALQDTECQLEHGDVLDLVYGRHVYEIVFKPPPEKKEEDNNISQKQSQTAPDATVDSGKGHWSSVDNGKMMVYTSANVQPSNKIAGYDIDGTIIRTKSGNVFPKNNDDWQIYCPEVLSKLKRLHEDGYKICLFTNQGGIAKGKVKLDDFKQKILSIHQRIGVPLQVYIAISDGHYRKPAPGMWLHLQELQNNGVAILSEKSFFVGDAAGRPEVGTGATKRRKDHSLADRLFAANIGVSFYTPEEHFLGCKTEYWNKPDFEPQTLVENLPLLEPEDSKITTNGREIIILMGLPGSGKSHFSKHHLEALGYRICNADTLGSTKACLAACEKALSAGHSCVIDNTNIDVEARKKFLELAKSLQVPCRCFVMNTTLGQVKHNIAFRQLVDSKHSKINDMVMNMMKKKYKEPTLAEGFVELVRVNFQPKFSDANQEALYKLYLVEK